MPHWGKLSFSGGQIKSRGGGGGGKRGGRGGGRGGSRGGGSGGGFGGKRGGGGGKSSFSSAPAWSGGGSRGSANMASALEDKERPFLQPKERRIVPVPLEFASPRDYCALIAHNLLAEFWHVYREGCRGPEFRATVVGNSELAVDGVEEDGMMQHLLLVGGSVHLVTNQVLGTDGMKLTVKPSLRTGGSCQVKSYGYVGSYISELKALIELAEESSPSNVLRSVLCPRRDFPGNYTKCPLRPGVSINASQRLAVDALQYALEKIQGPPGTGKSTTIFHIITARIPAGARVLVTCSRNVAVESIAQKLEKCTDDRMLVFGNASRIGETARRYLLDERCQRHPSVSRTAEAAEAYARAGNELKAAMRRVSSVRPRTPRWRRAWSAYQRRRDRFWPAVAEWCIRVGKTGKFLVEQRAGECRGDILKHSQIFLCTIASTSRMLREWEELVGEPLVTHTVIVDECGCTTESSVALLMRMNPANLIMVGDHKQLPPTSMVPPQELQGTGHDRSLLERCVMASGAVHKLKEQYRMHDDICRVVSERFYNGMLTTPPQVKAARQKKEKNPLIWVTVRGMETVPPKTKSYVNWEEISVATAVATRLRQKHPDATIAILTFYKGQLQELMRATPAAIDVEVLTVDSCQGSEFDYVILSTVRANRMGSIGFVKDKQRINVAISRSINGLVVVGNDGTLSQDDDWRAVRAACKPNHPDEWSANMPPSGFKTVFDALQELKHAKRLAAAEQQQQADAVNLMQHQPSMRGGGDRRGGGGERGGRGREQGPGYTVIGAGGAKAAAMMGGGSRGKGQRGGRGGGREGGGLRFREESRPQYEPRAPPLNWSDETLFPSIEDGMALPGVEQRKRLRERGEWVGSMDPWAAGGGGGSGGSGGGGGGGGRSGGGVERGGGGGGGKSDSWGEPRLNAQAPVFMSGKERAPKSMSGDQRMRIDKDAAARFIAAGTGQRVPASGSHDVPTAKGRDGYRFKDAGGPTFGWKESKPAAPAAASRGGGAWGRALDASGRAAERAGARGASSNVWEEEEEEYDDELAELYAGAEETQCELQRCADCGLEGDGLEPDVDSPGTFYCIECWLAWEAGGTSASAARAGAASSESDGWVVDGMTEQTLAEMFQDASLVREVVARFEGDADAIQRAFVVLVEMGPQDKKKGGEADFDELDYDMAFGASDEDDEEFEQVDGDEEDEGEFGEDGVESVSTDHASSALDTEPPACAQCGSRASGRVDEEVGEFYCDKCWAEWETEAAPPPAPAPAEAPPPAPAAKASASGPTAAESKGKQSSATPQPTSNGILGSGPPLAVTSSTAASRKQATDGKKDGKKTEKGSARQPATRAHDAAHPAQPPPPASSSGASASKPLVRSARACADCGSQASGKVDDEDGSFYCDECWCAFETPDAPAPPPPQPALPLSGTAGHVASGSVSVGASYPEDIWGSDAPAQQESAARKAAAVSTDLSRFAEASARAEKESTAPPPPKAENSKRSAVPEASAASAGAGHKQSSDRAPAKTKDTKKKAANAQPALPSEAASGSSSVAIPEPAPAAATATTASASLAGGVRVDACAECGSQASGKVDDEDGSFYCDECWCAFETPDAPAPPPPQPALPLPAQPPHQASATVGHVPSGSGPALAEAGAAVSEAGASYPEDIWEPAAAAPAKVGGDGDTGSGSMEGWTRSKVEALLTKLGFDGDMDPDVIAVALLAAGSLSELHREAAELLTPSGEVHSFAEELWFKLHPEDRPREPLRQTSSKTQSAAKQSVGRVEARGESLEQYVRRQFAAMSLNEPDIEAYVVSTLQMADDELSPLAETLEVLEEILSAYGIEHDAVTRFLEDAPKDCLL